MSFLEETYYLEVVNSFEVEVYLASAKSLDDEKGAFFCVIILTFS
jgi:hypothetical protein